jgi:hypothetical protein
VYTFPQQLSGVNMAKKAPRKRKVKYAPTRPVLSVRVNEDLYADISRVAATHNITLTEEIYRRLITYQLVMNAEKEVRKSEVEGFEAELERRGYTRISGPGGTVWAEPGARNINYSALPNPDLEAAIVAAIERGIAKALKDRK